MAVLDLFPTHVVFVGPDGKLTAPAARAMQALFKRVGGATGASTTDLAVSDDDDSGLEEFKHETMKGLDAAAMLPAQVGESFTDPLNPISQQHSEIQILQTELAGLREQVALLASQINDIQQDSTYGRNS